MSKEKLFTTTFTMPNGKRKYVRTTTKEALAKKLIQLRLEMNAGVNISDRTSVGEFIQTWVDVYKRPHLAENSMTDLLYTIITIILPAIGSLQMRSVKPIHIQRMMSDAANYSHRTQAKALSTTRAVFNSAVDNGLIMRSPVPATMKAHGTTTEANTTLTAEQSMRLLEATRGRRIHSAVVLMLGLGLRREEALPLMWSDIYWGAHQVKVCRTNVFLGSSNTISTNMKSEAAYRTVPMAPWVEYELRTAMQNSTSLYVCPAANGGPMTPGSFRSAWNAIKARTTDVPEELGTAAPNHPDIIRTLDFHVHPHLLRHTCATRWVEQGFTIKEVQYMLGHSTPDLTMRIYAHYDSAGQLSETTAKMQAQS